jgi:hypothetical protein
MARKVTVDLDASDVQTVGIDTTGPKLYPNDGNELRVELDARLVRKHKRLWKRVWREQKKLNKLFDKRIELLWARERRELEDTKDG